MSINSTAICALCVVSASQSFGLDFERLVQQNEGAVVVLLGKRPGGEDVQSSGCCIDPAGFILTTAHQVDGADGFTARLRTGETMNLSLIEMDREREIALLQADRPLPHSVAIGDAGTLRSGSPLFSIAAPLNLDYSAVQGIISSTNRTYNGYPVLQADLPASPGSSGGPVFDRYGNLAGMIIGKLSTADRVTVVNPVNNAYDILKRHGISSFSDKEALGTEDVLTPAPGVSAIELDAIQAYNSGVSAADPMAKVNAYGEAVRLLPGFYEAWFNRAVVQTTLDQNDAALESYARARKLRPDGVEAMRNQGLLLLRMKKYPDALECFQQAVRVDPDSAQSHNDLGEVLRQMEEYDGAIQGFQAALLRDANYHAARFNLGLAYVGRGQFDKAIDQFEEYLGRVPNAPDAPQVQSWLEKLRAAS